MDDALSKNGFLCIAITHVDRVHIQADAGKSCYIRCGKGLLNRSFLSKFEFAECHFSDTSHLNMKQALSQSIVGCTTRAQVEREGIKCFVRYAVENPNVYNIVWGSLAVERQMFQDYYVSFAESYARALTRAADELKVKDVTTMAYMLMGITNFLGLRAIFENMTEAQIDEALDKAIMPILEKGMFR